MQLKFTRQQKLLMQNLRDGGPISITTARVLKSMQSLKLLRSYGMVTNTTTGFALSAKGFSEVSTWE